MHVPNLATLLRRASNVWPTRTAVVHGDRRLDFLEVDRRSDALARALLAHGLLPGARIVVMAPNGIPIFESAWAIWKAGMIYVPLHTKLSAREITHAVDLCGAEMFLVDTSLLSVTREALRDVNHVKHVIELGTPQYEAMCKPRDVPGPIAEVRADDPAWLFFTSGSTGRPKAAMLGHAHLGAVVNNFLADVLPGIGAGDAFLMCAPMSHGAGVQMLANLGHGVTTVMTQSPRLDPREIWALVERHRISNIFTVPTILKMLVEHPAVDQFDHRSLRYVTYSGSPMYRKDQRLAIEKLGPVLVQLYGMSEVTAGITVLPPECHHADDHRHPVGSCGYVRTGMELCIKDADGQDVAEGQTGEICARGLNVFLGYYENPEANKESFRGGWFHTGDLGHLDDKGFLYVSGRNSDMLISGGQNVYPREIEEVLLAHSGINQVSVVGLADDKWGEIGVAAVVAEQGVILDDAEIFAFLVGKLAKYKWPRHVVFCDMLPISAYGKVTKVAVREMLEQRLAVTASIR